VSSPARFERAAAGLLAALAGVALGLAGCTANLRSSPSPSPSPATGLAAADSRFFSGDYQGAEDAYQQAIQEGTPDAHAHYALLLTYEARFREAVAEAQKGVDQKPDSLALAALTRALDWSDDPADAAAAGARAVTTKPVDPLARIFYGEALSDSGQLSAAAAQLHAAERTVRDSYGRAEVEREWGNYYADDGDVEQQLNYIELSLKSQPSFPERALELARYEYADNRADVSQQILAVLQKRHPKDYRVLDALGDTALIANDKDTAVALYTAALAVQPAAAEASLAMAEIDVAVNHDPNAAHELALAAVKKNPGSFDDYQFLSHLDQLVLHTDVAADAPSPPPGIAATLAADRKAALDSINALRAQVGVPALAEDAALAAGADAHAFYYLFNLADSSVSGEGIHSETSSLPAFTGADALQRARHFGYSGNTVAEVLDHVFLARGGVVDWTNSVFHRIPMLLHETERAGYGEAQVGMLRIELVDLGLGADTAGGLLVYPLDGQKDVPQAFVDREVPDPAPQGALGPFGYPITLEAGVASKLSVTSGRLIGPDGKEVLSSQLKSGAGLDTFDWSLLPARPLTPGATYTVEVIGTLDGQALNKRWSFTVARPPA
jgi:uncharacterized protein YkwD